MAKTKDVLNVLRTARGLIVKGWIEGDFAEDRKGRPVSVTSPEAVSFCAVGALRRAEYKLGTKGVATKARATLRKVLPPDSAVGGSVIAFNDLKGKKAVLKLFDKAIERVK